MQLDYIENINEYGDNIVRLYDFNKAEATKFRQAIQETSHFITTTSCSKIVRLNRCSLENIILPIGTNT